MPPRTVLKSRSAARMTPAAPKPTRIPAAALRTSDGELIALAGGVGEREQAPRLSLDRVQRLVGSSRFVMEQPETAGAARLRKARALRPVTVAPSLVRGQLVRREVRVENHRGGTG